jgi:hypothetical protein
LLTEPVKVHPNVRRWWRLTKNRLTFIELQISSDTKDKEKLMPLDSNLLKEAIADAKAVRQTALANAKVALEEAFSERYHAMFAEKLKEDAGTDLPPPPKEIPPVTEEESVSEQEIDELIKELEAEVGDEKPDMDDAPAMDAPAAEVPPMDAAPAAPVDGAPLAAGQTVKLVPVAAPAAPAPEVPPVDDAAAATPPSDVPPTGDEMDEEINLDELLQSLKEEIEGDEKKEDEKDETIDEQTKLASSGIGGKTGGSDNKKPSASAHNSSKIESGGIKNNGIPEGKSGPEDATNAARPNKAKNATSTNLSTPSKGGESGPALKAARPNSKGDFENTPKLHEENESLKKQLEEHIEVIKYVKGQLNEVNLLNAKLLYTNKLFKEFAMGNEQKMRVVEMFDLAKNVREVKLTYANIAESLNFGANEPKKKTNPVATSTAQSITEGLASKPVGSTKPSAQIISENKVSTQVTRFQKLAGIKGA